MAEEVVKFRVPVATPEADLLFKAMRDSQWFELQALRFSDGSAWLEVEMVPVANGGR